METNAQLAQVLQGILAEQGVELSSEDVLRKIETPKDTSKGDLAFPCFILAKSLKKAPPMIAAELLPKIETAIEGISSLEKVVAVGPYLNFFVAKAHLAQIIVDINQQDFLNAEKDCGQKVMIEYSQPNTHKAFHVGHMRNVALGDSLSKLYAYAGFNVTAVNYIGDEGTHIAKCLWAYKNSPDEKVPETRKGEFLGKLYAKADELLDLSLLTEYPYPNFLSAKVSAIQEHSEEKKWKVVTLELGESQAQVVCGGSGYEVGDTVVYAPPGSKLGGRLVQDKDMKGVMSAGCICSENELNITDDQNQIFRLPEGVALGVEVTELGKKDSVGSEINVSELWKQRHSEVSEVLKQLEDKTSDIQSLWTETKNWSMEDFKEIYSWVGAHFDHYFYESEVGEDGKEAVMKAYEEGKLIKSEGAIGADLEKEKLGFFMLLKSDGTGLYSTKDISLAKKKFDDYKIDRSIYVVGFEQSLHFKQVFKTLELLGYEKAKDCFHLSYGLVMLPSGKMSSRKGNVITFSQLQDQLVTHITENYLQKHEGDWEAQEIETAARKIAVATIRYGMLNQDNTKTIIFDLDAWTAITGNTGPYLLYAYARTQSVLRKGQDVNRSKLDLSLLTTEDEKVLLTDLSQFKTVVTRCVEQNKPQTMCIYLYQLCKNFSRFFENCPVLKAESEALQATRLELTQATGAVLKQGLALLGIETLDRM